MMLTSGAAHALQFVSPIGGEAYKDWTIVNYVDNTPGAGLSDYLGGPYTYDGHDAIDFTLPNFAAMYQGVSVKAAAAGTVIEVHDGEYDECSRVHACGNNPNYVTIDHGNGVVTQYLHLAKGSIDVSVGQTVSAGQQLAQVGSSGLSTDAHLHFAVFENGQVVDTYQDPAKWWVDPLPYAGTVKGVLDHGVTDHNPSLTELVYRPGEAAAFDARNPSHVYTWVNFFGTHTGDVIDFTWYAPDGSQYAKYAWSVPQYSYAWWIGDLRLPAGATAGEWRVDFRIAGDVVSTSRFTLAVPEPGTWALALAGIAVVGWRRRSRARAASDHVATR
ncbi:MAG TPA: peptidoglycan DD-metalloendopeptidase family protein [Candidatus Aquabacterium excrementipullorum]|nr:peptidoglycan DD-metalloendopeptidase family protein [Candidatus Aquabacterium excrementipullorum]